MNVEKIEISDLNIKQIGINAIIDFYTTIANQQLHLSNINAFITGVMSSSLNVAIDELSIRKTLDQDSIQKIIDFFKSKGLPWSWYIIFK